MAATTTSQYAGRMRSARLTRYVRVPGGRVPSSTALAYGRYRSSPERVKKIGTATSPRDSRAAK